jgi:hypothetical protein
VLIRKLARPSLADVAIVALFALVTFPRAAIPLIDGDVWWHIRAGIEVIETGTVPAVDDWSIAGAGMAWTSQDWLSNVLLAWVTGGGTSGAGLTVGSLAFACLAVVTLILLWKALTRRGVRGWFGRVVWLSFGMLVAGPVLGVRVQVLDLVLGAAALLLLWGYLADPRRRWLVGLPIVGVLWANLHAGWPLLFLLGGAVLVGEVIDHSLRPEAGSLDGRQSLELAVALAVSFGAVAVNPSGIGLYAYPIQTSMIAAHRDFLAEWSPPSLRTVVGQVFWTFAILGVGSALAIGWRTLRSADLLILIGLSAMAMTAARFLLFIPVAATVVAIAWSRVPASGLLQRMSRPAPSPALGAVNLVLIALLVGAGGIVAWSRISPEAQAGAIERHMPVGAVDWIIANDPGDRPFNTYSWGGYLGLRRPDTLVFIDGRSDIYGDGPIRGYADAISLRTDPASLLDEHAIDHVLFNTDHPFAAWLDDQSNWERVYSDPMASVWVRAEAP